MHNKTNELSRDARDARDTQEMTLWSLVYVDWYSRNEHDSADCGKIADTAVAEFRKRYPAAPGNHDGDRTTDLNDSASWRAGYTAAEKGYKPSANHYPKGTIEYILWNAGFYSGMDRFFPNGGNFPNGTG